MAYWRNLIVSLDVTFNAIAGGDPGETMSLRAARAAARGSRPGCAVCAILAFLVERDHCGRTLRGEDTVGGAAIKAALLVLMPVAALFALAFFMGRLA